MIISAVVAVALGAAPIQVGPKGAIYAAGQNMSDLVRDYRQSTDRRGTIHVEGHDLKGRPFELTIDRKGYVEGSVGFWDIAFHAAEAS
jgi:hypothetical protein